uniref:Putative sorbin and sh3 domain-containing protein n=1 Tax=Amblyomma aureolatum TaxID=187763 RepID=A0A1E1XCL1_9ACAR
MATKPLRPAPPPPVPKASAHPQPPSLAQRDSNNNKNERKNGVAPSRPTVIRPKVVHTPKKKPPPRPPPPKVGAFHSQGNSVQNESHGGGNSIMADIDVLFGTAVKKDGSSWTAPNGTSSSLFSRRTGLVRGQLNLFGSTGKGQQKGAQQPARKGPAPRQPAAAAGSGARSSFRKGAAPAPPVPPHRVGSSAVARTGKDNSSLLISFDSPPASPTCSVASGSSGTSSAASGGHGVGNGAPVSLLDLDVPPLQDVPWSGSRGLPHSRTTTFWGPSHEGGAGDATPQDDAWNFPRNTSLPSLSQEASLPPCDPWNFPETDDSSPTEEWSPPPPMHPPPALPVEEINAQQDLSGAAVAKQDYQPSAPGHLSLKVHDLVALVSEEGPEWYHGRCGNEEGLVPKRCLDVLVPPRKSSAENGFAVTCRRALYDFEAESSQELSLRQGDTIRLLGTLDNDWALGEVHGKRGRFPLAFLEPEAQPAGCPAVALYSFNAEQDGDLGFAEGDTVVVLSRINKDWLYGEHAGKRGQFPASFVQPISKNTSTKGIDIYRAAFAFEAQHADELTLRPGDKVQVTCKVNSDWWQGRLLGSTSSEGIFPAAFVESLS